MAGFFITLIISVFVAGTGILFFRLSSDLPEPYMDEVFHVPQAQSYCKGNYSQWDPMITTLPGLYLISTGILKPLGTVLNVTDDTFCSTIWLRSVNVFFLIAILYMIYHITDRLHRHDQTYSVSKAVLTSVTVTTLPVLYFFGFLYYTDAGSTFFVLFAYALSLCQSHWAATAAGTVAVLFRQTNIIWLFFIAITAALDVISSEISSDKESSPPAVYDGGDDDGRRVIQAVIHHLTKSTESCIGLVRAVFCVVLPYVLAVLCFIMFVYVNDGIVVGARNDHQAALHIPQVFYYCAFVSLFAFAHIFDQRAPKDIVRFVYSHAIVAVISVVLSCAAVWKLTFVHRYLLADNRHYTFYIWSRIYARYAFARYALVPFYLVAALLICRALSRCVNSLWIAAYCLCIILNLVPSTLLELRYFIIPYLMFRLNIAIASYRQLAAELLLNTIVNIVTLFMFLERPFRWNDGSNDLQRFMW